MSPGFTSEHETGGRGSGRARRLVHGALPLVILAVVGLTGCATKGDIRDVRQDLSRVEARQDSILEILQMQNRQILDSLQVTTTRLMNVRGELANQLAQLRDQLVQVGELTGQVQVRLNQFDQQLSAALGQTSGEQRPAAGGGEPADAGAGATGGRDTFSMAEEFYQIGLEQKDRGNARTARQAFQAVVDSFPETPLAPQSLFQVGETYVMEEEFDRALNTFDEVVRRYQDSDAAPRALYRAGVIAEQQGERERAREYFRRVVDGYPNSDARRLAEAALERMG
ncbi:MAG: tetratricopeptide repeat protein [Candidatus Longimicrobiales bacterium M2_2A_002]